MRRLNRFLEKHNIEKTKYIDYLIRQHELNLIGYDSIVTIISQSLSLDRHYNKDKNTTNG